MSNWDEAVKRVSGDKNYSSPPEGFFPSFSSKCRVVITGASGAGKTELFRLISGKKVPNQMSYIADEGRKKYKNFEKQLSLVTIPGQASKDRKKLIEYIFGNQTNVDGIIHVCSFGFNEIWPQNEMGFVETLSTKTLSEVRKQNYINEVFDLEETIEQISNKLREANREHRPKWIIILVSKADLYWNIINKARGYYHPLDDRLSNLERLKNQNTPNKILKNFIGKQPDIELSILPVALNEQNYSFKSVNLDINAKSQLNNNQREALNSVFFETLKRYLYDF